MKLADLSGRVARKLHPPPRPIQEVRVAPWFQVDGDKTLRLDYPLSASSVVFDVGGFEGQWASDIVGRFGCTVHVFEPVPDYVTKLKWRFDHNPLVHIHPFGLAGETSKRQMSVDEDRSSAFKEGDQVLTLELLDIEEFIRREAIGEVDLLKVNIEGGEYELLERLIQGGSVRRINNIQVQFHDFVPNAEPRMRQIQQALAETHELTYAYPFVWENWRRKAMA
ncbi:MAG: hypothetical protein QOH16_1187 [Gaiellaceae bacterium]|nr:hypothetical protein [Gaiellaceae bacterium]